MKKEVPTATPRLKSMCRITTMQLVAAQTKHRIRHGSINGYPCRHAYLSLSGSRSPKFVEIPKKSSRRKVFRNPVRLVSREQLYQLEAFTALPVEQRSSSTLLSIFTAKMLDFSLPSLSWCARQSVRIVRRLLVMAGKDEKWVMIVKAKGPSGPAKIHSDDPKHALGLVQYLRTIGYTAWIEDTNGNEIEETVLKNAIKEMLHE